MENYYQADDYASMRQPNYQFSIINSQLRIILLRP